MINWWAALIISDLYTLGYMVYCILNLMYPITIRQTTERLVKVLYLTRQLKQNNVNGALILVLISQHAHACFLRILYIHVNYVSIYYLSKSFYFDAHHHHHYHYFRLVVPLSDAGGTPEGLKVTVDQQSPHHRRRVQLMKPLSTRAIEDARYAVCMSHIMYHQAQNLFVFTDKPSNISNCSTV